MDNLTRDARSKNMSKIRNKDTKPEEAVRKYLFSRGMRFRKNDRRYPGKPDVILPKYRAAVFVNGCFWHHHTECTDFYLPKTNSVFWEKKLTGNAVRDESNYYRLTADGWKVIVVWECELKRAVRDKRLEQLYCEIVSEAY